MSWGVWRDGAYSETCVSSVKAMQPVIVVMMGVMLILWALIPSIPRRKE